MKPSTPHDPSRARRARLQALMFSVAGLAAAVLLAGGGPIKYPDAAGE